MAKTTAALLPATAELLHQFGDRLRLARLRRRLSAKQVAERAGMAPMTLRSLERGGSGVTMGAYLSVMQVLGIDEDLGLLGKDDPVGRALQDAQLLGRMTAARSDVPASAGRRETAKAPVSRARARKSPTAEPLVQKREATGRQKAPAKQSKAAGRRNLLRTRGTGSRKAPSPTQVYLPG